MGIENRIREGCSQHMVNAASDGIFIEGDDSVILRPSELQAWGAET